MGKHDSIRNSKDYEKPPHVPMFGMTERSTKKSTATSVSEALSSIAEGFVRAPACSQPQQPSCSHTSNDNTTTGTDIIHEEIKHSTLQSKYIEQLKELYHLFETTAITKEEYEEQKLTTLNKMKAL